MDGGPSAPLRTGGRPRLIGEAARAALLEGLRLGLTVRQAARRAGLAANTFYNERRRCVRFAAEWEEAVEACAFMLPPGAWDGSGRAQAGEEARLRSRRALRLRSAEPPRLASRRRRLAGAREESFLAALGETCDTKESAAAAGVHKATVYRRILRDPGFARANEAALERGYQYLERLAVVEREAARERLRAGWEEADAHCFEAGSAWLRRMDFDQIMRLLARYDRPGPKERRGRPKRRAPTRWEAIEILSERLDKVFGPRGDEVGGRDPLWPAEDWLPPE